MLEHIECEPVSFADLSRGPFARWYHRHIFYDDDQAAWLRDEVDYDLRSAFGSWRRITCVSCGSCLHIDTTKHVNRRSRDFGSSKKNREEETSSGAI